MENEYLKLIAENMDAIAYIIVMVSVSAFSAYMKIKAGGKDVALDVVTTEIDRLQNNEE